MKQKVSKIFRLARKEDYSYIPELGLWELIFDKRPVRGVRCDDPEIGAYEYNESRLKFKKALIEKQMPDYKFDFESVLEWASAYGSPEQCRIILKLFHAANVDEYKRIAIRFIQDDRKNYPYHLDFAIFFTGFNTRLTTNIDLIDQVEKKSYE